ncbi:dephospho-CoA kinase [Neoehrlichia mikurensis]|uniref:Dephospho-CoA kinase n=1 Tax=Neoehrlichia mikurensis TaxID=89586 RepID=A0A9Q9F391_9RICK|nr:dephospho-CoA kinase [Neoehrlichia mikurensis]QXK92081.1 dephospho-CoA kinase [Neoehrlichia mikurensis]QXK92538.1 dephospho-CoA kinase [Neoehrlichia mikurensis]QXK93774.1 dephospho-CoA kinase [Neoehrlichia mikurensis]UTO55250.1 dephospho-CoA kinase [Neoehrlichia mikurensis]UTO56171.1 dephospho-CoA kinase [Neoehrlichia mikurensis]
MVVFGLTGGIGSGKSLVANCFAQLVNAKIFDADKVVHHLYEYDNQVVDFVKKCFPDSVQNGMVNRKVLAKHFYCYSDVWKTFQQMIHSIVLRKQQEFLFLHNRHRISKYLVLDIPLLIEAKFHYYCDFIIYIYASDFIRKQRLNSRHIPEKQLKFIHELQISECTREKKSHFSINSGLGRKGIFSKILRILHYVT